VGTVAATVARPVVLRRQAGAAVENKEDHDRPRLRIPCFYQ
jgi:hypothetical protein